MHPLRKRLHNELHSRPSIYFEGPAHVYHFVLTDADDTWHALLIHIDPQACSRVDGISPHGFMSFETGTLKWEKHTEFFTMTLVMPYFGEYNRWPELPEALGSILAEYQTSIITAIQILVENESEWAGDVSEYGMTDPAGSNIGGGDAIAWSDFKLCRRDLTRVLLVNRRLNAYRLGRMVRRLLEIETYRMMASLTLPLAQSISVQVAVYDKELARLSDLNSKAGSNNAQSLLSDISRLSAKIVRTTVHSRQRFSATEAYSRIVFERIGELRESHVGDCQRLGIFIERRFRPTVRYCAATDQRLCLLGQNVANLGDLLQARVQVEVEQQNFEILSSLNSRAQAQIKIQKAVEGLSIIAITYYVLSLVKILYGAMHNFGIYIPVKFATLAVSPIVILVIFFVIRRVISVKKH